MIPTKTYPLSAIMGKELTDKERIAELEAELIMRREQAEGLQNQWVKDTQKIVALEGTYEQRIKVVEAETIERCAKVCEQIETESHVKYKQDYSGYWEGSCDGAGNCVVEIRALSPKVDQEPVQTIGGNDPEYLAEVFWRNKDRRIRGERRVHEGANDGG